MPGPSKDGRIVAASSHVGSTRDEVNGRGKSVGDWKGGLHENIVNALSAAGDREFLEWYTARKRETCHRYRGGTKGSGSTARSTGRMRWMGRWLDGSMDGGCVELLYVKEGKKAKK